MTVSIVLGTGFGDEGKGRVTSHLVNEKEAGKTVVVRFSGGHQAGHTIIYNGNRHVFSTFGSGTLQGAATYWSKHCTVYPVAIMNEYTALSKIVKPRLIIDPRCPVTTPYDIYANRSYDEKTGHGTCGVGVGKTFERHELLKLYYQDLFYPTVLKIKLNNIKSYYKNLDIKDFDSDKFVVRYQNWMNAVKWLVNKNFERCDESALAEFDTIIFEGSQGLLLDKDFGFFPNVTRANVSSLNALEIISKLHNVDMINVYYVTRTYQTRHGNGPMAYECDLRLNNAESETNVYGAYQGIFRKGLLDLDMLRYAISLDDLLYDIFPKHNSILAVTCGDQTGSKGIQVIQDGKIAEINMDRFYEYVGVDDTLFFASPETKDYVK